jgi:hypothetical protein
VRPVIALVTFPVRWWLAATSEPDLDARPAAITYVRVGDADDIRRPA